MLGGSIEGFILEGTKMSDVYDVCCKLEVGITGDDLITGILGEINPSDDADGCIDKDNVAWTAVAEHREIKNKSQTLIHYNLSHQPLKRFNMNVIK